jgi:MoaA/NifB/PqqE/SkfB family radical SAM enzyme
MKRGIIERVIEELVKVKPLTLIVSGGEPLLSPYFEYFIKSLYYKLSSRFPVTVIPSNSIGILVNKNSLQFLSEINKRYPGSITIYFSVHHSDPKVQEVFMGVKNIRDRLIEAINIVKSFELPFTLGMTPTKLNFNDLDNMFELSSKLSVEIVSSLSYKFWDQPSLP